MPIKAVTPEYSGEVLDKKENFHGNQVVYVGWDDHLMFCAAFAYLVSPTLTFKALIDECIHSSFSVHPEFSAIDWQSAEWLLDGQPFIPQLDVPLESQGIDHKSLLRFYTPGLTGFKGAGV